MKYVPPIGAADNESYVNENPATGVDGSPVDFKAIEHPLRELDHLISTAGMTPSESDLTQVTQAIGALIAAALASISTYGAGDGLEISDDDYRVKLNGSTLLRAAAGLALNLSSPNVWAAQQSCQVAILDDAATINWNVDGAQMAKVTIADTRLMALPSNHKSGTLYRLRVIHGAPNTTLSFAPGYKGVSGLSLSTASGVHDLLTFESDGTYVSLTAVRLNALGA